MIKVAWNNYDCDGYWEDYANIELSLKERPDHIVNYVIMFQDFLKGLGFSEDLIHEYIPEIKESVQTHIENRAREKFKAIVEKKC